jgi:hypothetical protein
VRFGLDVLADVLDREPGLPAPWRPRAAVPDAEVAVLCGRWWWMGREYGVSWDSADGHLVVTPLAVAGAVPWRFAPDGPDRWRGRSGMNDGEVLTVRRSPDGAVEALDIATFVFHREPPA